MACFVVAGSAFTFIAAGVTLRGVADLRQMSNQLRVERERS
ncbi:MAG TPA: hypothetical protein VKB56_06670 [Terriglobales bacterium]|nr:hypothetical protein [Terriglobales bacterium]